MKSAVSPQADLFDSYSTAKPGNPLFCHQEFLEKLAQYRSSPIGKRAALLLHRLVVDERRQYYKGTRGVNRGWRRSRLGGAGGSHFYAWWAPKGAPPLKGIAEFESAPERSIFLRDIRHHDDHSPLNPSSLEESYLPIGVKDLRQEEYVPAPWTTTQSKFATARQFQRIVKGYPGSGKTTALWHAADTTAAESVLYVTYSMDLAALARDHFDKFSSSHKRFYVVTFAQFMRELLGASASFESVNNSRKRFLQELGGMSPRILGPWVNSRAALYDEMHAHLVGSALPVAIGRFPASKDRHLGDRVYRDLREKHIGRPAAEAVLEVARTLRQRDERNFQERFFPELCLAWDAVQSMIAGHSKALAERKLLEFDCIALDEAQDLTPIEALAFVQFAVENQKYRGRPVSVLVAGDEAQTVRPTDFEWGWFQDLVHHKLGSPSEFKLATNLRSPRRIAELVNRVWDLYSNIAKQERPSGSGLVGIDEDAGDQIIYCAATPGIELDQLLGALSEREGLAVICLDQELPAYVPESLRGRILSLFEAKGLDFQSVCLLDPGKYLDKIFHNSDRFRRETDIEDLTKRLAIDQLRVAISRPADRLYWLDVNPSERAVQHSRRFLSVWGEVFPVVPAVVLKTLEEELLDIEERVRLCETDARQFLAVKPALAWSRAQQAVNLLETQRTHQPVDETVLKSAHLTLAEVAFSLAFRRVELSSELGRPDLYGEAARHAEWAGREWLAQVIREIGTLERTYSNVKLPALIRAMSALAAYKDEIEPWLLIEIAPKSRAWIEMLENALSDAFSARLLITFLPALYELFQIPDAADRRTRFYQRAIRTLMGAGEFRDALEIIDKLPEPDLMLQAECYEGCGEFGAAAELYLKAGKRKEALRNYRSIPDFEKALELVAGMKDHPAAESLEWLKRMQELIAQRPADFTKVILPAEKKLLEQMLEASLAVSRKKPAPRKAAAKKAARPRKPMPSSR